MMCLLPCCFVAAHPSSHKLGQTQAPAAPTTQLFLPTPHKRGNTVELPPWKKGWHQPAAPQYATHHFMRCRSPLLSRYQVWGDRHRIFQGGVYSSATAGATPSSRGVILQYCPPCEGLVGHLKAVCSGHRPGLTRDSTPDTSAHFTVV